MVKKGELYLLRDSTLKQVQYALSKAEIAEEDVYRLMKGFFKSYLHIDYEYTHEELHAELRKVYLDESTRSDLHKLLSALSRIEYADQAINQSDLRALLEEFAKIILKLIPKKKIKHSILARLLRRDQDELETLLAPPETKKRISELIQQINSQLPRSDSIALKKLYEELLTLYAQLDDDAKQEHYVAINEVYEKLTGL